MPLKLNLFEDKIKELVQCTACACRQECKQVVPPEFDRTKEPTIMVLGRNPGNLEDEAGRPFVGRGGSLLNDMLNEIGLERNEVYITNSLKCRKIGDAAPKWNEFLTCAKWLYWEINWLKPKLILALGNDAVRILCGKDYRSVTYTHGSTVWHDAFNSLIFLEYHPGSMLRRPSIMSDVYLFDLPKLRALVNLVKQGVDLRGALGVELERASS